jgi:hypothetical protein
MTEGLMSGPASHQLLRRTLVFVWDDPQRRCYNGAFGAHHFEWSPWGQWDVGSPAKMERRRQFWQELNDYAVSQRGKDSKIEYKVEPLSHSPPP